MRITLYDFNEYQSDVFVYEITLFSLCVFGNLSLQSFYNKSKEYIVNLKFTLIYKYTIHSSLKFSRTNILILDNNLFL